MIDTTLSQPAEFFACLYGGVLLGFCYDLFYLVRHILHRRAADVLCDLLFVVCAGALGAYTLLLTTGGALRWFALLGLVSGGCLERCSFGHLLRRIKFTK